MVGSTALWSHQLRFWAVTISNHHLQLLLLSGFATEIKADKLPFIVNWCGPHVQNMEIDDKKCQATLIKIIEALEQLQPNIEG